MSAVEAVAAAARGWSVFPVEPGGKRPVAGLKWRDEASGDVRRIIHWAAAYPGCNWGLDLHKSNLLAIDVDTKVKSGDGFAWTRQGYDDLLDLFARHGEPEVKCAAQSGNGGWHWIMAQPDPPIQGRTQKGRTPPLGHRIDVKSGGGYVLLAGSRVVPSVDHPLADGCYRWERWNDPQPPPPWLRALLAPPPPPPPPDPYTLAQRVVRASQGRGGGPAAHVARLAADLAATGHPGRNDALNRAAWMMRDALAALGAPGVVAALRDACRANGLEADGRAACVATAASGLGIDAGTVNSLW